MLIPSQFPNVTPVAKAHVYFDGRVVNHTLWMTDGTKKTLGRIYHAECRSHTDAPERMELTAGGCRVRLAGETGWKDFPAGSRFDVPGHPLRDRRRDGHRRLRIMGRTDHVFTIRTECHVE
jgi:uncharacterized protein YaiE (UPF0345 family)